MIKIVRNIIFTFLIFSILIPVSAKAQIDNQEVEENIFKAEIIEIIEEKTIEFGDDKTQVQQDLRLKGLEGKYLNEEIIFEGIGNLEVLSAQIYEVGDKVLMTHTESPSGEDFYYIV
ncbi:hypothetical protein K9M50_01790, partial [Patescibacteria group bacterium]|nr:hypothetical protein [Patescibacteria group bacterium]